MTSSSSSGISAWFFDRLEIGGLGLLSRSSTALACYVGGDVICYVGLAMFDDDNDD